MLLEREHLGRELEERVKRVKEEGEQRLQLERCVVCVCVCVHACVRVCVLACVHACVLHL